LETEVKNLYEGLFLVDSADAAADWEGVLGALETVLKRADAEIESMRKWDECKLAYEIKGKARGTYILVYFRADGRNVRGFERDVQLSERIMRVLVLRTDRMSQADIEKETPVTAIEKRLREAKAQQQKRVAEKAEQEAAAAEAATQAVEPAKAEVVKAVEAEPTEPEVVEPAKAEVVEAVEAEPTGPEVVEPAKAEVVKEVEAEPTEPEVVEPAKAEVVEEVEAEPTGPEKDADSSEAEEQP